jgi:hypothetical protein
VSSPATVAKPFSPKNPLQQINKLVTATSMSEITFNYYPQLFTATILEWKQLLVLDSIKQIIISSLLFLAKERRVKIYGFY